MRVTAGSPIGQGWLECAVHTQMLGFKDKSCHLQVCDFALTLHFLGLNFLIYTMGPVPVPILLGCRSY